MSSDKYEDLEKIGHGSFGVIRKIRRKADGFIMCRKEISYVRMSQKEREQLHAEFQILSTLRHPNIVAYYHREHLKASQDLHLYMEYCGNGDLGRVIQDLKNKKQLAPESFVWSIFTQTTMALYRCHHGVSPPDVGANVLGLTQGTAPLKAPDQMTILHRDLKPENVFLGEDNSVKLGDFGLSKIVKSHDFASTYVGTPFYMSPEICAAERYTLKSDIWSLGCIMYELCTRSPPFNGRNHAELIQKIKSGKITPLPEVYSAELEGLIRDCLKLNPDRRPDTAEILNKPVVRLMRKEKEVVDFHKTLKIKEDALRQRERDINDRTANWEREREAMRIEVDSSLRREWEVRARLEIDRQVNAEIEKLHQRFEEEIKARIQEEVQRKTPAKPSEKPSSNLGDFATSVLKSSYPQSSISGSVDDVSSATELTDYSMDSPELNQPEAKKGARTPFGRAQTMFAGHANTPQDIVMASPSPMAIASLSLSPRRTDATKAPANKPGNIFALNANKKRDPGLVPKWDLPEEPLLVESDEDEEDLIPSPTRPVKSVKNPFTSADRPVLRTQKTAPVTKVKRTPGQTGFVSKLAGAATNSTQATVHHDANAPRFTSPSRRLSKIPSAAALGSDRENANVLKRAQSFKQEPTFQSTKTSAATATATKHANSIKGRTLVELQQARAGGRPVSSLDSHHNSHSQSSDMSRPSSVSSEDRPPSAGLADLSPTRGRLGRGSGEAGGRFGAAAVWDPEKDEMPSPFLVRQKRMLHV